MTTKVDNKKYVETNKKYVETNKKNCYGYLNDFTCSAMSIKDCSNCIFYDDYRNMNYEEYKKKFIPNHFKINR